MKKLMACVAVLTVASGAAMAAGSLGVFGSYWNPKNFDDGFGWGGKLQLGGKNFVTEFRGGAFSSVQGEGALSKLELEVNSFEVGLALRAGDKGFSPYLGGGVGYYLLNGNADQGLQYQVDDVVGWYAVGGLEYALGEHSALHFEVLYRNVTGTVDDDSITAIKDSISLDLSGVLFSVGLAIHY